MSGDSGELRVPDSARVLDCVAESYGIRPLGLTPIGHDATPGRSVFRCDLPDGSVWSLQVYVPHVPMPTWLGGGEAREWLRDRAALLAWLEGHDYPAPRIIPARTGVAMAEHDDLCMVAVSYIPGEPADLTRDTLRQLGTLLGRLHALPAADQSLPSSWWYPARRAVAPLLDGLDAVAASVPARWRTLHRAFGDDLRQALDLDLPVTLIHGDCHPGNAIATHGGAITLIDWECAGMGAAALDLGGLLADSHPDAAPGEGIAVHREVVAAVLEGYRAHRTLAQAEYDHLPVACRFGVAFHGALRFQWALEGGWTDRINRSLTRLEARYEAAIQTAVAAQALL